MKNVKKGHEKKFGKAGLMLKATFIVMLFVSLVFTGCMKPKPVAEATALNSLVLIKNVVNGKVQPTDGQELVVTDSKGVNTYLSQKDSFVIPEDRQDILSVQLCGEGKAVDAVKSSSITTKEATQGTFVMYELFPLQASGLAERGTPIQPGVPVTGLSGSQSSQKHYEIVVPSGTTKLTITISGGTGDADLYVKKGSAPTISSWDYRSWLYGNNETIEVPNPEAVTWYIMIHGYSAYSGVALVATLTGGSDPSTSILLENGIPVTISGASDSKKYYYVDIPAGAAPLKFEISGGTGDADLYVKKGSIPTLSSWDFRPYWSGNDEAVTFNSPSSGKYYIMIHAYQAYSNVTLKATWGGVPPEPVEPGTYIIQIPNTSFVFDLESGQTGNGAQIVIYQQANSNKQRFRIAREGNGKYTLTNVQTDKVVEIQNSSTEAGARIQIWDNANIATQKWEIIKLPSGLYSFKNVHSGLYLDLYYNDRTSGNKIIAWPSNDGDAQKFKLIRVVDEPEPPEPPEPNKHRALLLGVASNLNYTDDDANDIQTVLNHLDEDWTVQKKIGSMTKDQVKSWIQSYASDSSASDVFLFSFSGHGGSSSNQSYLSFSNGTSMSVTELKSALSEINGTKIVLIDACQSGSFASMTLGRQLSQAELKDQRDLFLTDITGAFGEESSDGTGIRGSYQSPYEYYVIASCTIQETSYEIEYINNGIFTFFFADGMGHVGVDNPNGSFNNSYDADDHLMSGSNNHSVTYQEIYNYTKGLTQSYSNGAQTVQGNHPTANFVIGTY